MLSLCLTYQNKIPHGWFDKKTNTLKNLGLIH